jgi:hypothetical protein
MREVLQLPTELAFKQYIAYRLTALDVQWARALNHNDIVYFDWQDADKRTVLYNVCWNIEEKEVEEEKVKAREIFRRIIKSRNVFKNENFKKIIANRIGWYGDVWVAKELKEKEINFWGWKKNEGETVLEDVCYRGSEVKDDAVLVKKMAEIFKLFATETNINNEEYQKILAERIGWNGDVWVAQELNEKKINFWGWERANKSTVLMSVCYRGSEEKENTELVNNLKEIFNLFATETNINNEEYQKILAERIGWDGDVWVAKELKEKEINFWGWKRDKENTVLSDVCYRGRDESKATARDNARSIFAEITAKNLENPTVRDVLINSITSYDAELWVTEYLIKNKIYFWRWKYQNATILKWLVETEHKETPVEPTKPRPILEALGKIIDSGQLNEAAKTLISTKGSPRVKGLLNEKNKRT